MTWLPDPAMDVRASVPGGAQPPEVTTGAQMLHERLRVGAQMLQALEAEIARAQHLLEELDRRADETLASRFTHYERQISAREQALDRIDETLAAAGERAETLARMVESAEINIAVLAHKAARAART